MVKYHEEYPLPHERHMLHLFDFGAHSHGLLSGLRHDKVQVENFCKFGGKHTGNFASY